MKVPLFDMTRQYEKLRKDILKNLDAVFTSGRVILGDNVKILEEDIEKFLNTKNAIGVASGSDALLIAIKALDFEKGDYIITTPYTFFATASSITRNGLKPIFVDISEKDYDVDLDKVEDLLQNHPEKEKIKGFIPVHLFGKSMDLKRLKEIKEKYRIKIIEDNAQAIGARETIDGKEVYAGTVGDVGTISFFPTKNLGGYGDGGMIITDNDELAARIRKLRVHGAAKKYHHDEVGFNSRLDEVQAAILKIKLKDLEKFIEKRIEKAETYAKLFKKHDLEQKIKYPEVKTDKSHIYHQYVVELKKGDRDELKNFLKEKGVGTSIYYPVGLHSQECFKDLGYKEEDFPITQHATKTTLALPIFPELKKKEQEYVVENIKKYFEGEEK
jgi:dTDP-4-amino-4,6-dideoxygalactose transaminase